MTRRKARPSQASSDNIPLGLQPIQVLQLKDELIILLQQVKVAPAGTNNKRTCDAIGTKTSTVAPPTPTYRDNTQDIQFTLIYLNWITLFQALWDVSNRKPTVSGLGSRTIMSFLYGSTTVPSQYFVFSKLIALCVSGSSWHLRSHDTNRVGFLKSNTIDCGLHFQDH